MTDKSNTEQLVLNVAVEVGAEESQPIKTEGNDNEQSVQKVTDEIDTKQLVSVPGEETENASEEVRDEPTIPVPRIYKEAAKILKRYENKESNLQNLVYNCKYRSYKMMYGLMCNAVDNYSIIQTILAECKIPDEQPRLNQTLAHILTSELISSGHLEGDCKPVLIIKGYADKIKQLADTLGFKLHEDQVKIQNPRYVRINTLLTTVDHLHTQLAQQGWMHIKYDRSQVTYDEFLNFIQNLEESFYLQDYHIPNLLIFRQGTAFWENSLYKNHMIILQDKGCCLPVYLSNLRVGARVIDACAAPGSNLSYMAAVMRNTGKIKAFDKVFKHYKVLLRYIAQRGVKCAVTTKQNFTKVYQDRHRDVEYIFVDPPCSSSGLDFELDEETMGRVSELATVQLQLLLHALSFPTVKKVIYSTCSINEEENEKVVEEALKQYNHQFDLEDLKQKLPGWKHFGTEKFECGNKCIRVISDVDKCQRSFVAIFLRKGIHHGNRWIAGTETGMKRKWTADVDCSNNQTHQQQGQYPTMQQGHSMQQQGQYPTQQQGHYAVQQQRQYPRQEGQYPTQQQGQYSMQQGQYPMQQQGQYPTQQPSQQQTQYQAQHQNQRQMQHQNYHQVQHQNLHQAEHENKQAAQYQNQYDSASWNYQTNSNESVCSDNTNNAKKSKPTE